MQLKLLISQGHLPFSRTWQPVVWVVSATQFPERPGRLTEAYAS